MTKKLYIIDGHAHIYAAYFAPMRPLTSPAGEPTKAVYIFTTIIAGLLKNHKPDMLVVTMDSKTPSFRTKIYPDYKAHRPPMPDDMPAQIARIEQLLDAMRIPILRVDGFEADDLIGTLAKQGSAKECDVLICSKDKDMLQLLDKHVSTFDVKTGEKFSVDSMKNDMKLTPEQFLDCLALQGDTADNVPGVADVGPKTALGWIQEYGSIENLYDHADEIKGKRGESLRESKDIAMLSKELVTIDCDAPVQFDEAGFAVKGPDKNKLSELFDELGFVNLKSQFGLEAGGEKTGTGAETTGLRSIKTLEHNYHLVDTEEKFDYFLIKLKKQKLFAIDTETTSIDPMSAELVGINFCWQPHEAYYLPVRGPLGSSLLDIKTVRKHLSGILADETIKKIGQNIKYDLLVLKNAQMPMRGIFFDTMVASYCLDPLRNSNSMDTMALDYLNYNCVAISSLIGKGKNQLTFDMVDPHTACDYAAEDADVTYQLYEYLKVRLDKQEVIKRLFEQVEMPLVEVLTEIEYNGVSLDTNLLRNMSGQIADSLIQLSENIYEQAGCVFNIDSPKQLAEVLFDKLGLTSLASGKTGRTTNAAVLEQLADQHPIIKMVLEYRQLSKLQNTYVDKLGTLINHKTNRVHASFNQTITATGRLSSSDPNLQNIPIRTELGKKIRSAFIPASSDDYILSTDYSQIELRLLAHFSKDKALLDAFANDMDIHTFVASQIYSVPQKEVTSDMRSRCKAVNFGIIYGQGAFGLSQTIGISRTEAKKFIDDYFARYSSIRTFMDRVIEEAAQKGYAETILGRQRRIPNLKNKNGNKRSQAQRFVVNTVIQGSAADLIKVAMINIQRRIERQQLPVKMILQIHDELVFELPKNQAQEHAKWISDKMTGAVKLDVPLKVDVAIGPTWLEE